MIINELAKNLFDCSSIDDISPDNEYNVWGKTDSYGRVNIDNEISDDISILFRKTVGIIKSWESQLKELCTEGQFAILASYDDGSDLIEESDPYFGFTLRFWKIREGQGPDIRIEEQNQPVMMLFTK